MITLRDLILQVLFTSPGERVNLPDFGVGVQRLLFQPSDETLRSSAQFLISTNLQRWLGDRINVEQVRVTSRSRRREHRNDRDPLHDYSNAATREYCRSRYNS